MQRSPAMSNLAALLRRRSPKELSASVSVFPPGMSFPPVSPSSVESGLTFSPSDSKYPLSPPSSPRPRSPSPRPSKRARQDSPQPVLRRSTRSRKRAASPNLRPPCSAKKARTELLEAIAISLAPPSLSPLPPSAEPCRGRIDARLCPPPSGCG